MITNRFAEKPLLTLSIQIFFNEPVVWIRDECSGVGKLSDHGKCRCGEYNFRNILSAPGILLTSTDLKWQWDWNGGSERGWDWHASNFEIKIVIVKILTNTVQ